MKTRAVFGAGIRWLGVSIILVLGMLTVIGTNGGGDGDGGVGTCNGLPYMCEMEFDEVVFAGNHNAGSGANGLLYYCFGGPASSCFYRNQGHTITQQLEYGIRYFDIDSCICNDILYTCHNDPHGPTISSMLDEIDTFLHLPENQNEVIVITFGDQGDNPAVQEKLYRELYIRWTPTPERLERADLTIYKKPPGDSWPTLGHLVDTNQRIVVFVRGASELLMETGALSLDDHVYDTWVERGCTSSCSGVVDDTRAQCSLAPVDKLILVTVNCSYGLCLSDLANLCNRHIEASLMSCREARNDGVHLGPNFVTADWTNQAGDIVADVRGFNEMILHKAGFPIAYWSQWTSDELPPAECASLISGIKCQGRYCDDVSIQCAGAEINIDQTTGEWTGEFSDPPFSPSQRICPEDKPYATGVKCSGSYCDNMALQCSALANGQPRIANDCYWTSRTISEENGGIYEFPPSTYLAGMQCEGSYCDNLRLYLCEVPTQ